MKLNQEWYINQLIKIKNTGSGLKLYIIVALNLF